MIFRRLPEKIWQASTSRIKRSLRGARIQSSTARRVRDSNWQSKARHDLLLSLSDLRRLSATEGRYAAAGVCVKHGSRHGHCDPCRTHRLRPDYSVREGAVLRLVTVPEGATPFTR